LHGAPRRHATRPGGRLAARRRHLPARLLNADELAVLRRGIDANLAAPSPRAIVASQPDDPGFFIEDFCNWQDNADYRALAFDSPLPQVAARLMQSRTVRLYHDHMLTKEPGTRQKTPWHQDQPYYNVDGLQNVSFWIPVDPVARPSTLEFVAGSHRGPWLMPRTFMTHEARWFPEGSLADLPDIEANRAGFPILGWALEPGDVVAFHMLALHAAGGVAPGQRRRVFSPALPGRRCPPCAAALDHIARLPRPGRPAAAGAPMDDALFPLLVGGSP
jgi:hypothetical protein